MGSTSDARPRSRSILLVLIALFFAPLGLSFALYYGWHWRPVGQTNHGTLIEPPRSLPLEGAAAVNGRWFTSAPETATTPAARRCITCARPISGSVT
jgi:hypothetical protein